MKQVKSHAAVCAAFVAVIWMVAPGPAAAGHFDAGGVNLLPHATYKIWDLNLGAPAFGDDPNMTVSDPNGARTTGTPPGRRSRMCW